ncbi:MULTISPECIES: aconitate hydratase [unclassified Micromonospora]|uniref:aconitate hydratase n=1 Tax=unclassified Micromonospora TaxID=2617518 RepID=UPI003A865485
MGLNLTQKLIAGHLVTGEPIPGSLITLRIDQTLCPDTTGVTVMLELEAMGLVAPRTELSAVYVDHNLLQIDERSADDHRFLRSACRHFGLWYSPAGNGISHAVHMQRFGVPGRTLVGADSHTPAAGSLGMLAIGVGGLEVALAIAGRPLPLRMPEVWGVELTGALPEWVSAKDVILELLRRHGVAGAAGRVIEYHGPGLTALTAMDRHVIANMGTELGAVTSVFPADEEVRRFLEQEGRGADHTELRADPDAGYDAYERIALDQLEPLIALPPSPGNVVAVAQVAGAPIGQAYLGSSANPGLRDLAVPALLVRDRQVAAGVSFDINPASRQTLQTLVGEGLLAPLLQAGARLHQAGCNGCVGMGQAPASGLPSLRTTPRNFAGRSGTRDDLVHLVSPETATASALIGRITDPRELPDLLGIDCPRYVEPPAGRYVVNDQVLLRPPPPGGVRESLTKGPNIKSLPVFTGLPESFEGLVLLKLGDDVSTDEILPGGQRVLPLRSDIPATAEFTYQRIDPGYVGRARAAAGGHLVVAGENFGQGSSREHAVLAPRYLGLRVTIAKSYSRIYWRNLANFGVLALEFVDAGDHDGITEGDLLALDQPRRALAEGGPITVQNLTRATTFLTTHRLDGEQVAMVLAGSLLDVVRTASQPQTSEES